VKPGARALGVAESTAGRSDDDASPEAVLAGAVVRADRVVDDVAFSTCTVGATDATDAVIDLFATLDREDVQYLLLAGVAPAWFNVLDLHRVADATDRPVLSVSFEESPGLEAPLREHFEGEALAERLATYRSLPERRELSVNGESVYVRAVGLDDVTAAATVRGFTPEGGRPEPLRVARLAARAGRRWREG
jgi:endonuclease V-like protein UPF0215 family